jgi:hypothetical protein
MIEPRGMSKEQAAAYAGRESLSAFNDWIRRGIMPGPIPGTRKWDRKAIDAAVDRLTGLQRKIEVQTSPYDAWKASENASAAERNQLVDKKKLADGTSKTYWYAWKGGPRIGAEPGSPEFMRLYNEAVASYSKKSSETFSSLVDYFKDCSEYKDLGDKSKRAYDGYLKFIEVKFGSMPIGALEDKRVLGDFKEFRDSFSKTPRKADYVWTTIARVLSIAKDRGKIAVNVCERGGRRRYSTG